jgi:hypothetical protein
MHGLIGENCHLAANAARDTDGGESFWNSLVQMRVIEFVDTIVGEKVFERRLHCSFIFGVAQGSPDQHWGAIADIRSDYVTRQFRVLEVPEGGIDGMNQVQAGIDQRAIEIKHDQLDLVGIELAVKLDHEKRSFVSVSAPKVPRAHKNQVFLGTLVVLANYFLLPLLQYIRDPL